MKNVLFVDDEPHILNGLRNLLRKRRREWHMVFSLGGEAALVELAKAPFDVIVSDMRMPGMDGAELLDKVKRDYPGVVRIVLSGQADGDAIAKAVPVTHQFLAKPCDPEALSIVIERACNLRSILKDENIRKILTQLDKLPSPSRSYWELKQAVGDPACKSGDVVAIVRKDPAMCVKVMQLVNSGFYGPASRITSVDEAVNRLGVELLKALALTVNVFAPMEPAIVDGFSIERFQRHAAYTARLTKLFIRDKERQEEAFTAGLVHDIGKVAIAAVMPDVFAGLLNDALRTGRPLHAVEEELWGVSHATIGGYLLDMWGLPLSVVEAVTHHHTPRLVRGGQRDILAAVHVADAMANGLWNKKDAAPPIIDLGFIEEAGLSELLEKWRDIADIDARIVQQTQGRGTDPLFAATFG